MKSKNSSLNKGYSLLEIILALLILAVSVIPIIGNISSDTQNAVSISNSEFAMQRARFILDTMLDSVNFDDLIVGNPAKLQGDSKNRFISSMFPLSFSSGICQGTFTDQKGHTFFARLTVTDNKNLSFSYFKTPNLVNFFKTVTSGKNLMEWAEEDEKSFRPSYSKINFYTNPIWTNASTVENCTARDVYNGGYSSLMNTLVLYIQWNDLNKNNPQVGGNGNKEFYLVAHKARLLKQ